ncbi:MAG: glycogen debranching enzyme [Phycisphaerales bacterium]|nr:glycogen debranching enzyme [Phycisphaerales bacterium]MDB5356537.1 glycogen debranching enzyme [Phycisphaerales bacterium]
MLKHEETFAVFSHSGDIRPVGLGEEGVYHEGTRFLSRLTLRIDGRIPLLLSSSVPEDNAPLAADLTNPDVSGEGRVLLPRNQLHLLRCAVLWDATLYVRLRLRNYCTVPVDVRLEIAFGADYLDIFEVRGEKRPRRGEVLEPRVGDDWVDLRYRGVDGIVRATRLEFSPTPLELSGSRVTFPGAIPAGGEREYQLSATCTCVERGTDRPTPLRFDEALDRYMQSLARSRGGHAGVTTSNPQFDEWLRRSTADLHLMITQTPHGPYPFAGIPWFCTPFGRDGIITAFQRLWIDTEMARGVLCYLAKTQADREDPEHDAEPGKIVHEVRRGEMADLSEIPFGRYYGSVDSTPLFVMLAGAYYDRTGDRAFIESIGPNIERAIAWIERYGDRDGDGFVEYQRRSRHGLQSQGWKDSADSVFHADGSLAEGPIALCEVQGYAYAAFLASSRLARLAGRYERADDLTRRAERLRERFEQSFWMEDLSTYALALDGEKRPCRVVTSNPGHCLFSGIASPEHAAAIARTLLHPSSFSGWGVRTLADHQVRYNPMSYHNGSVWPHDNSIFGYGLGRYGMGKVATRILDGLFDSSLTMDLRRMPELFCGFDRRPGQNPTLYPVACLPQAWAAGSVFLLVQGCLGLTIDANRQTLSFLHPALPDSVERISISDLHVGAASVDLEISRRDDDVSIHVARRQGDVAVVVTK